LTLDELASDVAIALIADPGNHFVRIWRQEDAWGWDWGQESVPPLAEVVYAGRVDNSDVDLLTDLTDYDRDAIELIDWLRREFWALLRWPKPGRGGSIPLGRCQITRASSANASVRRRGARTSVPRS
jgi:hypothetical protein